MKSKEVFNLLSYICKHCDNLLCETSICPVCGKRTEIYKTDIFYCDSCNCPLNSNICPICGNEGKRIGSDIRPVFAEERLLLEVLLNTPFKYANSSVWCTGGNNYIVDGKKIKVVFSELIKADCNDVIEKLNHYRLENQKYIDSDLENIHIQKFIKANANHLNMITDEAVQYIQKTAAQYDRSSMFVSFSGGKDSVVTSDLVMRALNDETIPHIYGNTTLEYPETLKFIENFKKKHRYTPLLIAQNKEHNFENLCEVIGPPSRMIRWCCTIFKTGVIAKKIEQLYKKQTSLVSFQGIRRAESIVRSKYDRDTDSPKIAKQHVSAPIIDWQEFDVWLYIISNHIPFNNAYRQGFSRVGCWCCPNNGYWSTYLASIYMHEEYMRFYNVLYRFAQKIGKKDWKTYIDNGKWKARQGGNGLEYSRNTIINFKPCLTDEFTINFVLTKGINDMLYELFKPFGIINKELNRVCVLSRKTSEPIMELIGKSGSKNLSIKFIKAIQPFTSLKEMIECAKNQIMKFQICIACSFCQSVCKYNAIKVVNSNKKSIDNHSAVYIIDENKCVGCLNCVKYFNGGCYMKKVLRIQKGKHDDNFKI